MKLLMKKEWKLTVTPVPLLFLLLSALVLVPKIGRASCRERV